MKLLADTRTSATENEKRFLDFATASGEWFWETDSQGRFIWLSDAVEKGLGKPATSFIGKTRLELAASHSDVTREPWKSHLEALQRYEAFRDFQYAIVGPLGEQWYSTSGIPYFDIEGVFLGYRGVGSNITERVHAQRQANIANRQLGAAVEDLSESFLLCDSQDRIVIANRRFRELNPAVVPLIGKGVTFVQYMRIACAEGYFPLARGREEDFIAERLALRSSSQSIERQRSNGSWILVRDSHLPDGAIITIGLDITDRKRAEENLRESEKLLEQVIDSIPMSIFVKDTDSKYLMVNAHFANLHGESKQNLLGRHTVQFQTPEATREKSLRDDEWVFTHRQTLDQPELSLHAPNGKLMWCHSTKIPLTNETGNLKGLLGINRDITDQKHAQEALIASESRFSALFHNSLVPQIVSHPESGLLEDVNQAFADLVGYGREQLIGAAGRERSLFWAQVDRDTALAANSKGMTEADIDITLRCANGTPRIVLCAAFSIVTASGTRVAWSLIDVTDQRKAQSQMREHNQLLEVAVRQRTEQLTQANADLQMTMTNLRNSQEALIRSEKLASLGRLVAGVAHELNTPIGNSLLAATMLQHRTQELAVEWKVGLRRSTMEGYVASAEEATGILQRNLERAAELIQSFKQVATDQSSSMRREFNLCEMINELLLSNRPMLKSSSIETRVAIPSEIGLNSYPGPLGQVIGNLISNAVRHGYRDMPGGTITLSASQPVQDQVVIEVTDEGHGIPPENVSRVFDPFFSTSLGQGGSGLGLNIVYNIVTGILGGSITVDKEFSPGAKFTITLPLTAPEQDSPLSS